MSGSRRCRLLAVGLLAVFAAASGTQASEAPAVRERDRSCARMARGIAKWERIRDINVIAGREIPAARAARVLFGVRLRYADRCLDLSQLQSLGSHNSYHIMPRPSLFAVLSQLGPQFLAWEYTHLPLDEQFEFEGVRQIELDVFVDPVGGHYGMRPVLGLLGEDPVAPPELFDPGLKVLHVQDLDFETTCSSLVSCLLVVKQWSDEHPRHVPLAVLLELKQDPIPDPLVLGFVTPLPFGAAELDSVDDEIRSVFPPDQLLTPDDVRVPGSTLEESVLQNGWPTLGETRGRVLFLMDNGAFRAAYSAGRPNLEGRVLFTNSAPGLPDAAFIKMNDPIGDFDEIQDLVRAGYLVRTRADADTQQARTGDTTRRDAALASGAHFVSTDYASPDPVFGTGYQVAIPGGAPSGCNPLTAPPGCRAQGLEPDGGLPRR